MKKKRYTEEQIVRILDEIDKGTAVAEVARRYGVSEATLFRWKKEYAGMSETELKRLKALEEENRRLKKIIAQQAMDNEILRELLSKRW